MKKDTYIDWDSVKPSHDDGFGLSGKDHLIPIVICILYVGFALAVGFLVKPYF